jgi:subtilisin family serine protease
MALLLACLAWAELPSQAFGQDLSTYMAARGEPLSQSQQRITSSLRATARIVAQHGAPVVSTMMAGAVRLSRDGEVEVYVHASDLTQSDLETLQQHGAHIHLVEHRFGIVYASVAVEALEAVAALPFVRLISLPSYGVLHVGSVTSEGDVVMRAAEARVRFGIDGRGVRVGIISNSLLHLQDSVASGDLPPPPPASPPVTILLDDGSNIKLANQTDEGRALAEIVHDLAPGASLVFHTGFDTNLDTIRAVRNLVADGVDIIVDDIGFPAEPVFEDGPVAEAVQEASDSGVIYVTAAGNDADRHYMGTYQEFDPNDGNPEVNWHDFGAGDTTMAILVPAGGELGAFLQWPNPFNGSGTDDYDLLVFDASGNTELFDINGICTPAGLSGICASTNDQGNGVAPPLENIAMRNNTGQSITVTLRINRRAGAALPLALNFIGDARILEHNVASSSIFGHPCVRDALAVGAIDALDPGFDTIEPFSSRGPCEIFFPAFEVRTKPDLVAADGIITSLVDFHPFFGTSAAAPHVAAVAALLIEAAGGPGTLSSLQIANTLRLAAIDLGPPGADNTFGYGAVDAVLAVQALSPDAGPSPPNGGGGGGGCSVIPGERPGPFRPLEALGNMLLPVVVIVCIHTWRRYHGRYRRQPY